MNPDRKFYKSIVVIALATVFLLLIPLTAMQFTNEVVWTLTDFIFAGTLLFGAGLSYKLITRKSHEMVYRFAVGFALFTGLFLIWANAAVGIIGSETNDINLLYFVVIVIGIIDAFVVRFQAKGLTISLFAMAAAQAIITVIALAAGMAELPHSSIVEIIGVNAFFIMLFCVAALLFRYAALKNMRKVRSQRIKYKD